jgi:hypothetical protein
MNTIELAQFRKEIKALGFNIKTTRQSFGEFGDIFQIEGNRKLHTIFRNNEDLESWKPLFRYAKQFDAILKNGQKVITHIPKTFKD